MLDQDLSDKFEYSHYLFARLWMNIVGRSYLFITSSSLGVNLYQFTRWREEPATSPRGPAH